MINLLLKLGGLQAILLAFLLFKKKANNLANIVLAILIVLLGFSCLMYSFNNLEFYLKYPHAIRVDWGIPLLFGPLIYLYIIVLIDKKKWSKKDYLHFFPYLINLFILAPFFIKSSEEKIAILDYFTTSITQGTDLYFFYSFILRLAISVISFLYAFESIKILRSYRSRLLNEYSSTEKIKLEWLRTLLYSFMFVSFVFIVASLITKGDRYPQFDYNIYYFFSIFILIYFMSYKALSQPKLIQLYNFDYEFEVTPKLKIPEKQNDLSDGVKKLKQYMLKEKSFLNGELTASELAKELNISRHQLSRLLNEKLGKNFYDFINEYRVEEFKRRLKLPENDQLTLLGIAFDSGFNSKTTFNTIIKRSTGLTPSQYKKSLK